MVLVHHWYGLVQYKLEMVKLYVANCGEMGLNLANGK